MYWYGSFSFAICFPHATEAEPYKTSPALGEASLPELAIAAGLSAGARRGLLLKGGAVLEGLRKVTAVAFDKTGTLTEGKPVVTDIVAIGRSEKQVLSLAAALESGSSHPLALAILARASADKAPIPPTFGAKALGGKGVIGKVGGEDVFLASPQAASEKVRLTPEQSSQIADFNDEGKTVSVLLVGDQVAGLFAIRDEARADAIAGLKSLRDSGIATIMLTGDNTRTANAIAKALGIEARAELLPEDKQRIVREMQAGGKVVAKVAQRNDAARLGIASPARSGKKGASY